MKIHNCVWTPKDYENEIKVYITIDDEKNIKEISSEPEMLDMTGIQTTAWISKKQIKKLERFPRPPMDGKLMPDNISIRIYTY